MTERERAREIAWKYVDYAPRTVAEVQRRLKRASCPDEEIEAAVAELTRAGVLDDDRFAREWTEARGERRGIGPDRLAAELRRKGIARETVLDALVPLDEGTQLAAASSLAERWLHGALEADAATRRRLAGYLRRRGYNWPIIEQVFAKLLPNKG